MLPRSGSRLVWPCGFVCPNVAKLSTLGLLKLTRTTGLLLLLAAANAGASYDLNDLTLGASEAEIKKNFPNAYCRELEWPSGAAERRCDDSRISVAGVDASVTFYL